MMKCTALLFGPLFALALGCNTAQISQPGPTDAGLPCSEKAPVISCNKADAAIPGACQGEVTVALNAPDASDTIPSGIYPPDCKVTFFTQDPRSPTCLLPPACKCVAPDAGAGGDAGDQPGDWNCFPQQ